MGALDAVLFDMKDPAEQEAELERFARGTRPVLVKAVGEPVLVRLRGEEYEIGDEPMAVVPTEAIDLLYLYGREGIYRGRDQATGHSDGTLAALPEDERERIAPRLRILRGWLTHVEETPRPAARAAANG